MTMMKRPIAEQLRRFADAAGLTFETRDTVAGIRHVIDGREMTPGDAADRYLPGGFTGSYGQAGKVPSVALGQRVEVTADGHPVPAAVVAILGGATYDAGFVAVLRVLREADATAVVALTSGAAATEYLSIPA